MPLEKPNISMVCPWAKIPTGAADAQIFAGFPGRCGYIDEDGYVWVMGRTDDIINVAGHRLSTGGMEEVLASHQDVAECAVLGIADELKGEVPAGFIVLKAGVTKPADQIEKEIVALVREKIGPVAAFKLVFTVPRPPVRSMNVTVCSFRLLSFWIFGSPAEALA